MRLSRFPASSKEASNKRREKQKWQWMQNYLLSKSSHIYLDELCMLCKIKSFKVLFRKKSGLQKWTSICIASLGIIRLEQELTSGSTGNTIISYLRPTQGRCLMQMTLYRYWPPKNNFKSCLKIPANISIGVLRHSLKEFLGSDISSWYFCQWQQL